MFASKMQGCDGLGKHTCDFVPGRKNREIMCLVNEILKLIVRELENKCL